ncbi:MAG: hypothetical protein AB1664_21630, partial [Thermodesulfobacteriota bacterium]
MRRFISPVAAMAFRVEADCSDIVSPAGSLALISQINLVKAAVEVKLCACGRQGRRPYQRKG